ncbi:hypothetical protein ACFU9Y_00925 [Streptomyces sp. NPDC057621]|uniref:hypothetical protein n=1 Tax=Streptomyces sp. NPDC057621 TaxID=3346186 RepID=UPI0036BD0E91
MHHKRPFTRDADRWETARSQALHTGHVRGHRCALVREPMLVHERTPWGWLAWNLPGDGTPPQAPHHVGVLTPDATRTQRLALRWLTRRPAPYVALHIGPVCVRFSAVAIAVVSFFAGQYALDHGVPAAVALPVMPLAPLLAAYLPGRLDARAGEHVRSIDGEGACRYLQRLASLHTTLIEAAAGSDRYELRRSAEVGHHLLWDAAGLLQAQDTRSALVQLVDCERAMLQLSDQVTQMLGPAYPKDSPTCIGPPRRNERPAGLYPPGFA